MTEGFTARRYASALYAVVVCPSVRPSVRPPVCPSVTRPYYTKTTKPRIKQATSYDSSVTPVFWRQRPRRNSDWVTPTETPNRGGVGSNRRFSTNISLYLNNSSAVAHEFAPRAASRQKAKF